MIDSLGPFTVAEYQRDLSVMPSNAAMAYYCNMMNVRKRQVLCDLKKAAITLQAGAMQWMVGNVNATTGLMADSPVTLPRSALPKRPSWSRRTWC